MNDGNLTRVYFSDGDLRRTIDSGKNIQEITIDEVMSPSFKYIDPNALAAEAARIMQESNVYVLIVKSESRACRGHAENARPTPVERSLA